MADPVTNADGRYVIQPAETSADTLQVTARTATNIVVSATAGIQFASASLARNIITMVINGVTYYVPASTSTW